MKAVEEDSTYSLIHPRTGEAVQEVRAQDIFEKMVTNAHATGEPGLVFLDRINENDPLRTAFDENGEVVPGTEEIEATNPCGEQPLGPGDACNLGSINLTRFIDTEKHDFDWDRLRESVHLSVRFLDDVVEANHYPLPFINAATRNNRRIGLGIMGWAESLILLGIVYDSESAVQKAEELMSFIQKVSHEASRNLAEERGCFPNWKHSTWSDRGIKMRNVTVTTIAPTGTISIIAGTSSGIEPLFAISFVRRVMGGTELIEVNPLFEKIAKERGFYSVELMEKIAREGTLKNIEDIPEDVRKVWVCSHDISYDWHVRMQVAFQRFTDNAVSKTINLPHTAPLEDVRQAYLAAWRMGLKGITVYRDASRALQVLNIRKTDPTKQSQPKPDTECGEQTQPVEQSLPVGSNGKNGVLAFPASVANRTTSNKTKVSAAGDQSSNGVSPLNSAPKTATQAIEQSNVHQISEKRCTECGSASTFEARYEACVMCRVCGYTKC